MFLLSMSPHYLILVARVSNGVTCRLSCEDGEVQSSSGTPTMGARTPAEAVDRFFFHELWACILPRRLQESHAVLEMASGQYARDEVERSVRTCTQSTTPPSFKPSLIGSHTSGARQRGGLSGSRLSWRIWRAGRHDAQ